MQSDDFWVRDFTSLFFHISRAQGKRTQFIDLSAQRYVWG